MMSNDMIRYNYLRRQREKKSCEFYIVKTKREISTKKRERIFSIYN